MQAYNNRNNTRSSQQCGYCRGHGHSIQDCPNIEYDFKEWSAHRVPVQGGGCKENRWFLNDYSYWVKQVNKYYPKWVKAQERKANKGKPQGQRTTAPRKCGFCRSPHHTRKDCPEMSKMTSDLRLANANYRQAFYDKLVKEMGLGLGAVVKVQEQKGYGANCEYIEHIGIVDGFDISEVNLFGVNSQLDREYCGYPKITVSIANDNYSRPLDLSKPSANGSYYSAREWLEDDQGRSIASPNRAYRCLQYVSTVAPSKDTLDESWVSTEAMADEFAWLTKKRTAEWLQEKEVPQTIAMWRKP